VRHRTPIGGAEDKNALPGEDVNWTHTTLAAPHDVPDKVGRVRHMFNSIAPRYALVNTIFSAGRDRLWRRRAAELAETRAADVVLDVACGTGEFADAFERAGARLVVGCDFAHEMLVRAASRWNGTGRLCEGDALHLPFPAESFTITSCAFGIRNFGDLPACLAEMFRVLRPGGRAVILEFSRPANRAVRFVYELYANHVMPTAASIVSGDRTGAYRYLPRSVVSFLDPGQTCAELRRAGFSRCQAIPLTAGVVTVYLASREL